MTKKQMQTLFNKAFDQVFIMQDSYNDYLLDLEKGNLSAAESAAKRFEEAFKKLKEIEVEE